LYTTRQEGYMFTSMARLVAVNVHLNGGAFPGAHCAASVVMVAALGRAHRRWGNAFLDLTFLIFISTVYGRFHYVTDTISGLAVAIIVLFWSAWKCRLSTAAS
jgi:membrane-associated phospholipid phosphatase